MIVLHKKQEVSDAEGSPWEKKGLELISSVQVTMWHPLHDISAPRLREAVDECSCLRVRPAPHCERERADLAHSMKIEIKDLNFVGRWLLEWYMWR